MGPRACLPSNGKEQPPDAGAIRLRFPGRRADAARALLLAQRCATP